MVTLPPMKQQPENITPALDHHLPIVKAKAETIEDANYPYSSVNFIPLFWLHHYFGSVIRILIKGSDN